MLENLALCSRLFVLVCAAVVSFIMCSDAARASTITQVDNSVKHKVLRRLYTPNSHQHHQLFIGPLSPETGPQTMPSSETVTMWHYRKPPSIINHQSNPRWLAGGSFGYNQNNADNRHSHAEMTRVQSGMQPANNIFTSSSQHGDGLQSGENDHPTAGSVYNSYPAIIRKSSHKEAASPFHQSSSPSQVWAFKDAQKSYREEKAPRNDFKSMVEVKDVWQPPDSSLSSSQTGRYSSTSLPTQGGHYSSIQSRKYLSSVSQTAPHAPSIRKSSDASVIRSNPSTETPTSSIKDFSQGGRSWQASSAETPRQKKVQSYLFKDSKTSSGGFESFSTTQHKQTPSDAQVYSTFSSNFRQLQQSDRKDPTKEVKHLSDNANPLYQNAKVAHYGALTGSSTKSQHTTSETLAPISVLPVPRTDNTALPQSQGIHAHATRESVPSNPANTTKSGTVFANNPGRTIESIYGFRGFKYPTWGDSNKPSVLSSSGSNESTNSKRNSFDKGKFKISNLYPSLSQKYTFGQRKATITTLPEKLDRTPTGYFSPSLGIVDTVQTMSTQRPSTSGYKKARPRIPERDAGFDSKPATSRSPDHSKFRIYRRIYGLKGFGTQPLEGARALVTEPHRSASVQQGLEGLKHRNSQIWQPKSSVIQRYGYNKTFETEHSRSKQSIMHGNGFKQLLKTSNNTKSVNRFTPDAHTKNRKMYNFLGFQPVRKRIGNAVNNTHLKYKEQSPSLGIPTAFLRSTGPLTIQSHPESEPRRKTKPLAKKASLLHSSTSSTVRGKRVKGKQTDGKHEFTSLTYGSRNVAIFRPPKHPARVKAVTYSDIVGSALFIGVRATAQTPITPAGKSYNRNATAVTKAGEAPWTLNSEGAVYNKENSSRGLEGRTEDAVEDFRSVKENKIDIKSEEVDLKTSDFFLDIEGSGSGDFHMSDVLSTKSNALSEDLLELDYLRISAGNVSFKSINMSHNDK